MVLTALRGALGFLSRLPVGHDERAWEAFRRTPASLPLAGYVVGAVVVLPLVVPAPAPTVAALFVAWVYLATGIVHADGLTDFGDAIAVHGDPGKRRAVMTDTTTGVGGALSLAIVTLGLALAGFALASAPLVALPLVIATEVGVKLGMALLACLGAATHDGLGAALTGPARPRDLGLPALVALPAGAVTWPHPAAAVSLIAALGATAGVFWWARAHLGGVNGDVFGAGNEIARVVALHAGMLAWVRVG